jgi:hypothetical protein
MVVPTATASTLVLANKRRKLVQTPAFVNHDSMRFLIAPDSSTGLHLRKERRVFLRVQRVTFL